MTAETIHTCSYSCERPECIRAQRDELAARLTAETSNARGEWPERYACNGPEGTFWTDDAALANKLIAAAFDRDEWTVTDTQNPTGATPPPPADARGDVWGLVAKLAAHVRPTCSELWNEAQAFLAAEGVQAGEVSAYDLAVLDDAAETLDRIGEGSAGLREARARIASALSQQPEAQGGGEATSKRDPYAPTDMELLRDFISVCRDMKPVGKWPNELVCAAIERLIENQKPFRFIAEVDKAPERGHNGRGGDADRTFSGPRTAPLSVPAHGTTLRFGLGAFIVNTGTSDGEPAVFVDAAPAPGPVSGKAPDVPAGTTPLLRLLFPTGEQAQAVCDALVNAPPRATVGVELSALRVQEWLHREHDILCPVQEIEQAMRTPCSCPFTELALAQQPAAGVGEEIMVNAAHDVYTLPLQPSGLLSGPRFVVHVPGPEQPAAVDWMAELVGLLDEVRSHFTRDDDLPDDLLPRIDAALAAQHQEPKS